jgi:hypothetical protein
MSKRLHTDMGLIRTTSNFFVSGDNSSSSSCLAGKNSLFNANKIERMLGDAYSYNREDIQRSINRATEENSGTVLTIHVRFTPSNLGCASLVANNSLRIPISFHYYSKVLVISCVRDVGE